MALHTNLKKCREEKGFSQEVVAKKMNVSRQTISKWENGKRCPDVDSLIELSNIYKVSIDNLLKDEKILHRECREFEIDDKSQLYTMLAAFSIVTPLGMVIAITLLVINKRYKRKYKIVTIICVVSIIINIIKMTFNIFLLISKMGILVDFI